MTSYIFTTYEKVTDINQVSGIPYHFWRAAQQRGFALEALDLPGTAVMPLRRGLWALRQKMAGHAAQGFRWTVGFLERAWRDVHVPSGAHIINNYQLFPPSILDRAERSDLAISFYIDLTMAELLGTYHQLAGISRHLYRDTIALETRGYRLATRIAVFSRASARTLRTQYGVPQEKISIVPPGANLDEAQLHRYSRAGRPWPREELVIGFVGMDWKRKGLIPLADAVTTLRQEGLRIRLIVVGPTPSELAGRDGISFLGRIDKQAEMQRFLEVIAACDLGALPSEAEGLPISLVEFLRMGIPVIGTEIGGIPDALARGGGILMRKAFTTVDLTSTLRRLATHPKELERLRENAKRDREYHSWHRAIRQFEGLYQC
jgi:glycosyltransferase involved in cell wall biosynthesis